MSESSLISQARYLISDRYSEYHETDLGEITLKASNHHVTDFGGKPLKRSNSHKGNMDDFFHHENL